RETRRVPSSGDSWIHRAVPRTAPTGQPAPPARAPTPRRTSRDPPPRSRRPSDRDRWAPLPRSATARECRSRKDGTLPSRRCRRAGSCSPSHLTGPGDAQEQLESAEVDDPVGQYRVASRGEHRTPPIEVTRQDGAIEISELH